MIMRRRIVLESGKQMNEYFNKIRFTRGDYAFNPKLDMLLFKKDITGLYHGSITWNKSDMGEHCYPAMTMEDSMGQDIMDQLWQCGIRPSEGTGSAGSLKATQMHLADMQKLVFKGK